MGDIYRQLAAEVAGKPEAEVTDEERARAKGSFWEVLSQAAQLPGNSAMLAALGSSERNGAVKFANFTWQSRWNGADAVAALSTDGPDAFATGFMGVLKFRFDRPDDVAAIVNAARRFADMVEQAGQDYASADTGG